MKTLFQTPLDRTASLLMLGLIVLICLLIGLGDHTTPRVKDFSWEKQPIGAEDRAFTMTFNRPMNWEQIQPNLSITPPLDGKLSWSGRRLAYTILEPVKYGQKFQLSLKNVEERQKGKNHRPRLMRPFESTFQSRPQAFVYLGTNSEESGRLVLYQLNIAKKTILTPKNLEIFDFQPFPQGDRILFSATELDPNSSGALNPELFVVSTGIEEAEVDFQPQVKKILGDNQYQLLKFDLSPGGDRIVLQRAIRSSQGALGDVSLWQMPLDGNPTKIEIETGGDFQIAPDGQTLVIGQGQGLAVIPLDSSEESDALDYLPEFGTLLSFSLDGTSAAMVKFNNDFTRSLFLVTNQGEQRELTRIQGGILSAQFDPQIQKLYCLFTRVIDQDDYAEQPYLAVIDLKTDKLTPLLDLPLQPNITMSLAPDSESILFDQVLESPSAGETDSNAPLISTSNLWQLKLSPDLKSLKPEKLTSGARPNWLP